MATILKQSEGGQFESIALAEMHSMSGTLGEAKAANPLGFDIIAFRDGTRPSYALITRTGVAVRVNGSLAVGGLCVLQHKDELLFGSQRMFFSAESAPVVEVYRHDGSGRRPRCPVCRAEIQDGQSAVRCPGCSRLYHQIDATGGLPAKPCWTYSPTCRFCDHPTSMSGEPTWQPNEEA